MRPGGANERVPERASWPVYTRLRPPLLRADVIPRERLLEALSTAVRSYRFTLVSAPAGYGKTTLLSALPHACPDLRVGWLSLDEEDNDPARFLAGLIAALQRLNPGCCAAAQNLLVALDNPASRARLIVGALINEVLEETPEPFVLVLDDLHIIDEPAIHAALDYLVERLPPQMRLAVATRQDPPLALARLRARRQVAELRLEDLRFTPEEADRFLNETLRLGLSPEQLATLQAHTEGWPVGISLLVTSLGRTLADRDAFVACLARTDRHVFDFLAEEVLDAQEPAVRSFLLGTSILAELTPELCAAVTDRADAPAVLEDLYRRNLFIEAADGPGATFRYHDLFKEFLRKRLVHETPERIPELHRRAAESETVPSRAIRHYLAAQMWDEAANAIERIGEQMRRQGSIGVLRAWIQVLPERVRESHPRLSYLLGRCAWMTWELDSARSFFERALKGFEAAGDEAGQVETLVQLATFLSRSGDVEGSAAAMERVLTFRLSEHQRAQALTRSAWQGLARKDWAKTNAALDEALALAEGSRDPRTLRAVAGDFFSPFTALPGGVERAERLCRLIRAHIGDGISPLQVVVHDVTTFVHLWRGRWEAALEAGVRALDFSEQFGGLILADLEVGTILPVCHALRGDHATADHLFDALFCRLERPATEALVAPWMAGILYLLGRVRWLQGRLEGVREAYARMCAFESEREWPMAPVLRAMMQGVLHLSDQRYAHAERSLRRAAALQDEARYSTLYGNAYLLLAHLYLVWDRPDDALAALAPVLAEHEREGTPGFVGYEGDVVVPALRLAVKRGIHTAFAARVLELFGATGEAPPSPSRVPRTGESLTVREVEVLRLISSGASNKEIANELVLSIHTVKRHVANVLNKLDVASRTRAAARARELGVL